MLISVLVFALLQPVGVAEGARGSDLFEECRVSIAFLDAQKQERTVAAAAKSNRCVSYIEGLVDAFNGLVKPRICLPDGTLEVLIRKYVAHMQVHPEEMDKLKQIGLIDALTEGVSCPSTSVIRR